MGSKRILLDTDIGCDCDDAGAMAVLHTLADKQEVDLIAVTHTTTTPYGAACIDAINRYYGRPDIPIGALKGDAFLGGPEYDIYAGKTGRCFPGPYTDGPVPDALHVMRRVLQDVPDKSATLLLTGQMRNAARLLRSAPDAFSPLDGTELVRRKVGEIVIMGGCFFTPGGEDPVAYHLHAEYNLRCDIESAQYVADRCPVPIVYCGFELGSRVIVGKPLLDQGDIDNPVRFCYAVHRDAVHSDGGRESWDLLTALYAAKGMDGYFAKSPPGWIHVDGNGLTHMEEAEGGRDAYLIEKMPPDQMQQLLDNMLLTPPRHKGKLLSLLVEAPAV